MRIELRIVGRRLGLLSSLLVDDMCALDENRITFRPPLCYDDVFCLCDVETVHAFEKKKSEEILWSN